MPTDNPDHDFGPRARGRARERRRARRVGTQYVETPDAYAYGARVLECWIEENWGTATERQADIVRRARSGRT